MKKYIKSDETVLTARNWYFGEEEAEKYKDLISSKLNRELISKRMNLADRPRGLAYEADKKVSMIQHIWYCNFINYKPLLPNLKEI